MRAEFDETAYFQSAVFNGEAQISVAKFTGYADFTLVSFRQNVLMNYTEFANQAIFNNSNFSGRIDFLDVKFEKAEFNKCFFIGKMRFDGTIWNDSISFKDSVFLPEKPEQKMFEL